MVGLEEKVDRGGGGVDGDDEEEEPRDEAAEAVSVAMGSASHHRRRRAAGVSRSADRGGVAAWALLSLGRGRGGESSRFAWLVASDGWHLGLLYYGRLRCSVPDPLP